MSVEAPEYTILKLLLKAAQEAKMLSKVEWQQGPLTAFCSPALKRKIYT
jgi:hypothetical protein